MDYKKSFDYTLIEPVEIDSNGKAVMAHSVEVFAPTNQVMREVNVLDVEFQKARNTAIKATQEVLVGLDSEQLKAFREVSESNEAEAKSQDPLELVNEMIANGADIDRCFMSLQDILTAGNKVRPMCLIDVEKMTKPLFEKLGMRDTKKILGTYILDFLDSSQST